MEDELDYTLMDLDRMVRTIWGEARSDPPEVWEAIAKVIITRANWPTRAWWGYSIEEVCTSPWQFSCWNPNDPNQQKLKNVSPRDKRYAAIEKICLKLLNEENAPSTDDATHYCKNSAKPVWRKNVEPLYSVGNLVFFKISPSVGQSDRTD
jgi:N-acetylmuramoyl-L-alanine amidase